MANNELLGAGAGALQRVADESPILACIGQHYGLAELAVRAGIAAGVLPIPKAVLGMPRLRGTSAFTNPISAARLVVGDVHLGVRILGTRSLFGVLGRLNPVVGTGLLIYDVASIATCATSTGGAR